MPSARRDEKKTLTVYIHCISYDDATYRSPVSLKIVFRVRAQLRWHILYASYYRIMANRQSYLPLDQNQNPLMLCIFTFTARLILKIFTDLHVTPFFYGLLPVYLHATNSWMILPFYCNRDFNSNINRKVRRSNQRIGKKYTYVARIWRIFSVFLNIVCIHIRCFAERRLRNNEVLTYDDNIADI